MSLIQIIVIRISLCLKKKLVLSVNNFYTHGSLLFPKPTSAPPETFKLVPVTKGASAARYKQAIATSCP